MDNIPENAALGITLASGGAINMAFLVAIFVSTCLKDSLQLVI
jgi:hypothetical protein